MPKFNIVSRIKATLLLRTLVHSLGPLRIHLTVLSLRIGDFSTNSMNTLMKLMFEITIIEEK